MAKPKARRQTPRRGAFAELSVRLPPAATAVGRVPLGWLLCATLLASCGGVDTGSPVLVATPGSACAPDGVQGCSLDLKRRLQGSGGVWVELETCTTGTCQGATSATPTQCAAAVTAAASRATVVAACSKFAQCSDVSLAQCLLLHDLPAAARDAPWRAGILDDGASAATPYVLGTRTACLATAKSCGEEIRSCFGERMPSPLPMAQAPV